MVYELTLDSVKIKTTIFDPPAKLINYKELSCAFGMAFKEAGLPCPEPEDGKDIREFWSESLETLKESMEKGQIRDSLKRAMEGYVFKPGEVMDQDARITLRLGYEAV